MQPGLYLNNVRQHARIIEKQMRRQTFILFGVHKMELFHLNLQILLRIH
jgi:hypothetical protein